VQRLHFTLIQTLSIDSVFPPAAFWRVEGLRSRRVSVLRVNFLNFLFMTALLFASKWLWVEIE
jgi:hypothetical protein